MLLEADAKMSREALSEAVAREAAARDRDGGFPTESFALLARDGLLGDPPVEPDEMGALLRVLAAVGRGDLSVGRIFEGHVNAVLLIRKYGTAALDPERLSRRVGVPDAEDGALAGDPGVALALRGRPVLPDQEDRVDMTFENPSDA